MKEIIPIVSIIIPVYNGSNFIKDAIDSALNQTYKNIEIIVVNDGSNDQGKTEYIAKTYGKRIRYYFKNNGGVASALNFGITQMHGEYFSWLSHDDVYCNNKTQTQVATSQKTNNSHDVVYSDFEMINSKSEKIRTCRLPNTNPKNFRYFLTTQNLVHGCTLLIPKICFEECGLFDESLRTTQDYDLWFKMAAKFKFIHLPKVLVRSRIHPEQGTNAMGKTVINECNNLMIYFTDHLTKEEMTINNNQSLSFAYASLAVNFTLRNFKKASNHALFKSLANLFSQSLPDINRTINLIIFKIIIKVVIRKIRTICLKGKSLVIFIIKNIINKFFFQKRAIKYHFTKIYQLNLFNGIESKSGEGSSIAQTAVIRKEIPKVLKELNVKVMIDAPCGDLNWMKEVNLEIEKYIGVDIVDNLIQSNIKQYSRKNMQFLCLDIINRKLPEADLILCRDCLVHLSFKQTIKVIRNFKNSPIKYLMTTTFTDRTHNDDLKGNDIWRPINLQQLPFNFPKPLIIINEKCTEGFNNFKDKSLAVWLLDDINI